MLLYIAELCSVESSKTSRKICKVWGEDISGNSLRREYVGGLGTSQSYAQPSQHRLHIDPSSHIYFVKENSGVVTTLDSGTN